MKTPTTILFNKQSEIESFDKEKFINSLKQFGEFDKEIVDKGLQELSQYTPLHYSRLVELGVQSLKNENDAKKYYERYWKYSGIFNRLRRITGYISSDLSTWNDAKKAEEKARIKHISSERKLTSKELKKVKEIEIEEKKKNQESYYGKN